MLATRTRVKLSHAKTRKEELFFLTDLLLLLLLLSLLSLLLFGKSGIQMSQVKARSENSIHAPIGILRNPVWWDIFSVYPGSC